MIAALSLQDFPILAWFFNQTSFNFHNGTIYACGPVSTTMVLQQNALLTQDVREAGKLAARYAVSDPNVKPLEEMIEHIINKRLTKLQKKSPSDCQDISQNNR
jgi:hypothetical protein